MCVDATLLESFAKIIHFVELANTPIDFLYLKHIKIVFLYRNHHNVVMLEYEIQNCIVKIRKRKGCWRITIFGIEHKKRPAPFHKDASLKKNLFLLLMFRIQGTSSNSLLPSQEYP